MACIETILAFRWYLQNAVFQSGSVAACMYADACAGQSAVLCRKGPGSWGMGLISHDGKP